MDKYEKHEVILEQIHQTYIQKNTAYGDSFTNSCDEFGVVAAIVRMSDKWNRLKTLTKDSNVPCGDESVKDTLLDLANYAIMTYMWLEEKEKENEN